jgi:hypothetical protein
LKVAVPRLFGLSTAVEIGPVAVDLPDLDYRPSHWFASGVEHATSEMGNLPNPRREGVVEDQQVVVGVEGKLVGIEGPFGRRRSSREFFRQQAGCGEGGRHEGRVLQELATVGEEVVDIHRLSLRL